MQTSEARRSERVHYRGPVELCTAEGAVAGESVPATAVDLGAGGMRVYASVQMPVGAQVTCRIELEGRAAALPGRVAWLALGDGQNGIGICFDPLGEGESALLQSMVERSRDAYRPVELRFEGADAPIRARARARTNGLRLSAELPLLARGTELTFRLDEEGPQFKGRVSEASLHEEPGARRLEVDVDVIERDCVRFRRRARYGYALEIESDDHRESVVMPIERGGARAAVRAAGELRAHAVRVLALLVAAGSGAAVGWGVAQSHASSAPAARAGTAARETAALTSVAAQRTETMTDAYAPPPRAARSSATEAPAAAAVAAAERESPPVQATPGGPDLGIDGDVTRVLLPFEGSLVQMQARLWAQPFALAIDLPNGRTLLDEGSHRLRRGGVGDVRIHRRDGMELLRVELTLPLARYDVTAHEGSLELRLVRQPIVAPSP